MTREHIAAAAQAAVFQSFHRDIDADLLRTLLTRVAEVPYCDDVQAYAATVAEVARATLQPLVDSLRFECMATSPTIH